MKTLNLSRLLAAFLLIFALSAVTVTPASATLLSEGAAVDPADGNGMFAIGTLVTTMTSSFSNPLFSGILDTNVYDTGSGMLDFWYRLSNDIGSANAITRLTVGGFAPFTTDVYDRTDNGGGTQRVSNLADRSSGILGFGYGSTTADKLNPGETGAWVVVRTDARAYRSTTGFVIDGEIDMASTITADVVPEPGTYALMGLGLVVFALLSKRRRFALARKR